MVAAVLAAHPGSAGSVPLLPDLNARLAPSNSTPWTILFVLTLITLLPAILMAMTPLVRLLVVFHFLLQALGTQTAPSNPTLLGLALMMTWFLMAPVLTQVDRQAVEPYRAGQISGFDAIERGAEPVKQFLLRYAREKALALFTAAGQIARPNTPDELPMRVVVPAYILSELKAGFAIGAVLFLPFLRDGKHGRECVGDPASESEQCIVGGEPEQRSGRDAATGTQLPGGVAGVRDLEHDHGIGFEPGGTDGGLVAAERNRWSPRSQNRGPGAPGGLRRRTFTPPQQSLDGEPTHHLPRGPWLV